MAYTNLETVTWDSKPNITVVFDYDYKRSGSDMQYKVRVTVKKLPTTISTFGYPIYVTISLDGVKKVSKHTIKNASPNYWTDPYVYETDWLTVSGKTSGNTALSVNLYSIYGSDAAGTGTRDETYSYNLTVSPAASIPTAEASIVQLGGSVKIFTNSRDSSYYHRIGCKFGSYSHWGEDIFDDNIAQSWFLFSPPISLASEIPNATSGTCTIYLATYSDAECTKQVGETQSMTLTLTVPTSVKPTVSTLMLTDEAGYFATFGAYVQGKSRLKLNVTASSENSSIKSYTFIVDGKTTVVTSNEATVDLPNAGTIPVIVRVMDGRGRVSTDYSTTITVLQYSTPKINFVSAVRCKDENDGTPDPTGTCVNVTFSGTISPLSNVNAATWRIQRRKQSATSWSSSTVTPSDKYNPAGISMIVSGIVADSAYVFRIRATDTVTGNVYSVEVPVPAGFAFFKTNAQLNGLTFGRETVKENTLGVALDMEVDGELSAKGGSIELNRGGTLANYGGYIDFHFNKSNEDYTSRIIEDASGRINIQAPNGLTIASNITFNVGEQTSERNISFKNTNGANPHNCQLYGGNPTSATGIGMWDAQNSRRILSYTDSDNKLYLGSDDGSCGTILYGSLTLGGHSTPVGSIKSGTSTTKKVAKNSTTNLTSVTLPSGVWILLGGVYTASLSTSASNGVLRVTLGDTSTSDSLNPANNNGYGTVGARAYGSSLPMYKEVVTIRDGGATVYLNVVHNIQDELNITGQIRAIRIV